MTRSMWKDLVTRTIREVEVTHPYLPGRVVEKGGGIGPGMGEGLKTEGLPGGGSL